MANKPSNQEPDEIGKPHARPGSERARDEQRDDGGPRYGGEAWEVADERGDRRFGHARNDDADPSELARDEHSPDDDEWPNSGAIGEQPEVAEQTAATDDGSAERGGTRSGQGAGFGMGEKPMKVKARSKKNPQSGSKRKTDRG
jgi:hypothetical protein